MAFALETHPKQFPGNIQRSPWLPKRLAAARLRRRLAQEFLALEIAASRFLGHNLIKLFLILADQPLPSFLEAFSVFGFTGFEQDTFGSLA